MSTWANGRPRRSRRTSAPPSMPLPAPMRRSHVPRASAAKSRCLQGSNSVSNSGSAARQTHDGRNQEQHDRDEEDRLGDFDGGARNAAKAKNTGDERDDQEGNDPTQHDNLRLVSFPAPAR